MGKKLFSYLDRRLNDFSQKEMMDGEIGTTAAPVARAPRPAITGEDIAHSLDACPLLGWCDDRRLRSNRSLQIRDVAAAR
jgi:hypothetical protein